MPLAIMAILTKVDHLLNQQRLMPAAVRGMADKAILFHRRMLPDERSAFVGMTLVTELVVVFGIDHVGGKGAMGIVAIGTLDLPFDNGMV